MMLTLAMTLSLYLTMGDDATQGRRLCDSACRRHAQQCQQHKNMMNSHTVVINLIKKKCVGGVEKVLDGRPAVGWGSCALNKIVTRRQCRHGIVNADQ